MSDIDELVSITYQLSQRLESMAANELKFGFDLGYQLDQLSYDSLIIANNLKSISQMLVGGVA